MKLYKFRSIQRLDLVLDIVLNERLYCAPYKLLNDPFEGLFTSQVHFTHEERAKFGGLFFKLPESTTVVRSIDDLVIEKASVWKVCSLSLDLSEIRLWSHYADAHKGVAVEIDFVGHEDEVQEVLYEPKLQTFGYTSLLAQLTAKDVLRYKTEHWRYEAEYRVIGEMDYYSTKARITGVYCGARMHPEMALLIRRAIPAAIPVFHTKLNEHHLKVEKGSVV